MFCWHKWSKWIAQKYEGTSSRGALGIVLNQERKCEKCGLTQIKAKTIMY